MMDISVHELRAQLSARVIGQDHAVDALARAVTVARAGLLEYDRPLASLLFVGPTGVGKTVMVRALAEIIRSNADDFCRVDMSSLAQEHYGASISGAPPGYAGSKEGLTIFDRLQIESDEHTPGIVLFDEIEKAHPTVIRTLLHVLDNGLLRLSSGTETINFRNCIVVMTSNLGGAEIARHRAGQILKRRRPRTAAKPTGSRTLTGLLSVGAPRAGLTEENQILTRALQEFFDPEFLNRLDDIVAFNDLDRSSAEEITAREVSLVCDRLRERSIHLSVSPEVIRHIASVGFDPAFGVRALKRGVQRELLAPLATALQSFPPRGSTPTAVQITLRGGLVTCQTLDEHIPSIPLLTFDPSH